MRSLGDTYTFMETSAKFQKYSKFKQGAIASWWLIRLICAGLFIAIPLGIWDWVRGRPS